MRVLLLLLNSVGAAYWGLDKGLRVIVRRLPAREQGIKAENRHGGTYGMLRDGEDKVFGELWRKTGPQARTNNFLMGALPRYGGHISAGDSLGPILPSHLQCQTKNISLLQPPHAVSGS